MSILFTLVPLFIGAVFVIVIGAMVVSVFRGISQWFSNNQQPVQTAPARVATKRQHVSGGGHDTSASTHYYVTFEQTANGDRQEFSVDSRLYSGLAEGDFGRLTFQGTRFHGFERDRQPVVVPPPPVEHRTCTYCEGRVPADAVKCPSCGARDFVGP